MKAHTLILAAALMLGIAAPAYAAGTVSKFVISLDSSDESSSEESSSYDDQSSFDDESSGDESSMDDSSSSSEEPQPTTGGLVSAENPQSVVDALSAIGYPAKLGKLKSGRPTISLRIAGVDTYIDFYDCDDNMTNCYTLLFGADATLKDGAPADKVNDWNAKQITGRVWTDDKGQPTLDYTLSTFDGVSTDVFEGNLKAWADDIEEFKSEFGLR